MEILGKFNGIFCTISEFLLIVRQIAVPLFKKDSLDNMVDIFFQKGLKVIEGTN
jgi:hypothetical protein